METWADWLNPPVIWFIVGFVLILLEFGIPGLITLFFGIGAWIVSVICLFLDISLNLQLSIFLISSVLLLVSLRKWFKTLFTRKPGTGRAEDEVADEFIGQKAVVTEKITPNRKGRVEFRGSYWTAESYETIPEGASVEILDKDNITLIVKSL